MTIFSFFCLPFLRLLYQLYLSHYLFIIYYKQHITKKKKLIIIITHTLKNEDGALIKIWPPFSWRMVKKVKKQTVKRQIKEILSKLKRKVGWFDSPWESLPCMTTTNSPTFSSIPLYHCVACECVRARPYVPAHVYFGRKELHFCFISFFWSNFWWSLPFT